MTQPSRISALVLTADDVAAGRVVEGWGRYLRALAVEFFVDDDQLEPHLHWLNGPDYVGWINTDEHGGYALHLLERTDKGAAISAACLSAFATLGAHDLLAVYRDFWMTLSARSDQASWFLAAHDEPSADVADDAYQELADRLAELDDRLYAIAANSDALERALIAHALKQWWVKIVPAGEWDTAVALIGRSNPHYETRRKRAEAVADAESRAAKERKSPGDICCAASGRQVIVDGHIVRGCTLDGVEYIASLVITDREAALIFVTADTYVMFPYRRPPNRETATVQEIEAWEQWTGKDDYRIADGCIIQVPRLK